MKTLDSKTAAAVLADVRALESQPEATEPYPADVTITQPNRPSRVFNLRLTDDQYAKLHDVARERHLPVSTMARSWLIERLDHERPAS